MGGHALRNLLILHVFERVERFRLEQRVAQLGLAHRLQDHAGEDRLELRARLVQIGAVRQAAGVGGHRAGDAGRRGGGWGGCDGLGHRTINSALSAPASFSASRMATRSDGAAPMAFTALTTSASLGPGFSRNIGRRSSSTATPDLGVTTVWPPLKGAGWLTR